ncbi:MAG: hypothetical protein J6A37_11805 [Oscillospiraceae bacterium]|nr:hypothetical protein [Oscillospiraceae bacterium]
MNTAKRTAKFKGAVLIMILAVMTVLIILLAGSIAVVYSAHNRAVVKYSESQGYYTARSVLDNFFEELSASTDTTDSSGTAVGTYYSLDLVNSTVKPNPMCIGRALELDLYKAQVETRDGSNFAEWLKVYCDENEAALNAQINTFEGTSNTYTGTQLYQKFEQYYVNLNTSKLTDSSTYSQFYNQFTPVTPSGTNQANLIRYDLTQFDGFGSGTLDTDGDGSPDTNSQFGKLSDNGAGKVWITVEVLERIYDFGEGADYADRFKAGKRSEDHIVAKVTAHVIYDNEEITTTQIWESNPPPVVDADTGLSSLGPINDSASITGVGDVATLTKEVTKFSNDPTFSGNVFFEGSLVHNNTDATATLEKGEVFFVGETYQTSVNKWKSVNEGTVFYAKRFQLWGSNSFTENDTKVNIIAEDFSVHTNQGKNIYGNIFAENFNIMSSTSELTETGVKTSVQSGNMVFDTTNKTQIHGNVFCNYLGIPADRVTVEWTADTAIFHVNYKPDGTLIVDDNMKVENIVDGKIHVLKGIKIIDAVEQESIGKDNYGNDVMSVVNSYETFMSCQQGNFDKQVDYFRNAGTAGANKYGATIKSGGLETDFPLATHPGSASFNPAQEYQVQIDFSKCNTSKFVDGTALTMELNLDYYEFIDENNDDKADSDNPWQLTDDYYREFNLPTGTIGGTQVKLIGSTDNKFKLPTHRSIYRNYFYESISSGLTVGINGGKTFHDGTGSFSMATDGSEDTPAYTFETFLQEHAITAEAVLANIDMNSPVDILNVPEMGFLTTPATIGPGGGDTVNGVTMPASNYVISTSGYLPIPTGNEYNSFKTRINYIDARTNDIEIQLGDDNGIGTIAGAFVVYGDKHVTVKIPGKKNGGDNQVFNVGESGAPFVFATADIFNGDPYSNLFVIGEAVGIIEPTPSPNIDWYFSKHIGQVNVATGGGINGAPNQSKDTVFCGYITAPSVFFNIDTNCNGIKRPTWYYGDKIQPDSNAMYTICGSIFCKEYKGGQHSGVCFIPRDDGYTDDGSKPMLNKDGMYRARR